MNSASVFMLMYYYSFQKSSSVHACNNLVNHGITDLKYTNFLCCKKCNEYNIRSLKEKIANKKLGEMTVFYYTLC